MTNATLRGKPDAGNPHVRFDEGEVASAKPRRGSLLYIFARCESLIMNKGEDDAIARCAAYIASGADGIMIHSKQKTPDEIISFVKRFRAEVSADKPIVVVPSTYSQVTEDELAKIGVNIVIYANQLLRASYPAMRRCAERILECGRCQEASAELCMPIKEILTLI